MRLIDADEFAKEIDKCLMYGNTAFVDKYEVLHRLNNAPTIEAEPIRYGEWTRKTDTRFGPKLNDIIICSECKIAFSTEDMFRRSYCPNCGAKMDKGEI